jgi:hypothetical protein
MLKLGIGNSNSWISNHAWFGYSYDIDIWTALIDLHAKCKNLQFARTVFVFPQTFFNANLVGFIENDNNEDPMVFHSQPRLAGIKRDSVSFSQLLRLSAFFSKRERSPCIFY